MTVDKDDAAASDAAQRAILRTQSGSIARLVGEKSELIDQLEGIQAERDAAIRERDEAQMERSDAERERDEWEGKFLDSDEARHNVTRERDGALGSYIAVGRARDAWKARADAAMKARHNVTRERDEALEASALFQRDVHEWRTRAEAAEALVDQWRSSSEEWKESHADAVRERDEAVARAEKAERERDALREEQWPRDAIEPGDEVVYLGNWHGSSPCPRGAVFTVRAVHEGSGRVSFDWPGVDGACVDLSRVRKVENRAEAAEARTAPAVMKADIEECIYGSRRAGRECDEQGFVPVHIQEAVEQLWGLHKGDDPAVLVVRESGIAAIKVEQDSHGEWFADGEHVYVDDARQADHLANEYMTKAVRRFAVARAIEQDAASDPLLGKAQEFAALADWELTDREAELLHTVAAYVLGQEAGDGR